MAEILTGPDCSHHQGVVDWRAVKNDGHAFAFCKLTDNVSYRYLNWGLENIPKARATGLITGAYHWLAAGPNGELRDPAAQAREFLGALRLVGGPNGLLCAVDVERQTGGSGVTISLPKIDSVKEFARTFFAGSAGHPLIVYSGKWYWVLIGNPYAADIGVLWHSEYEPSVAEVRDGPELDHYGGWPGATFWQFTSNDQGLGMDVAGVNGLCDLNRFFGTREQLLALTRPGKSVITPTPYKGDDEVFIFSCTEAKKPVFFCGGGKAVGLNEQSDLATFANLPHFKLDLDTYNVFVNTYRP